MKINWKVRFQNKTFWATIIPLIVTIVYTILGFLEIVPSISETEIVNVVLLFVEVLAVLGVIIDPTTSGASDSEKAMTYEKPAPSITTFLNIIKERMGK